MVSLWNTASEKLPWYGSAEAQLGTMGSWLLLFASAVVLWPMSAVIRRLRSRNRETNAAWEQALWVGWAVCALKPLFVLVFLRSFGEELAFDIPPPIPDVLVIPIVTSIFSAVLVGLVVISWSRGQGTFMDRLYYSLIALASVLFVPFADYWNMLGWRF